MQCVGNGRIMRIKWLCSGRVGKEKTEVSFRYQYDNNVVTFVVLVLRLWYKILCQKIRQEMSNEGNG